MIIYDPKTVIDSCSYEIGILFNLTVERTRVIHIKKNLENFLNFLTPSGTLEIVSLYFRQIPLNQIVLWGERVG
jgi:hypothetical protein